MPRVLILDDDSFQSEMAATILREAGFESVPLTRWTQLLGQLLDDRRADVLLLDYWLESETGLECYKRLLSHGLEDIKVVFYSTDDSPEVRGKCESVGAEFLAKSQLHKLPSVISSSLTA